MMRRTPWAWTQPGVVLNREQDGSIEQVWLCPDLPPQSERAAHPTRVEVLGWFNTLPNLNTGLLALWQRFGRDSVMAAIRRKDDASRVLVYTAADQAIAYTRYLAVRGVLRPAAMGLRLDEEPGWEALDGWVSALKDAAPDARE